MHTVKKFILDVNDCLTRILFLEDVYGGWWDSLSIMTTTSILNLDHLVDSDLVLPFFIYKNQYNFFLHFPYFKAEYGELFLKLLYSYGYKFWFIDDYYIKSLNTLLSLSKLEDFSIKLLTRIR